MLLRDRSVIALKSQDNESQTVLQSGAIGEQCLAVLLGEGFQLTQRFGARPTTIYRSTITYVHGESRFVWISVGGLLVTEALCLHVIGWAQMSQRGDGLDMGPR